MTKASADSLRGSGFYADTCLREIAVPVKPDNELPLAVEHFGSVEDCQLLRGAEAYAFLLQTITGLNSSIPGETNVQGQIRKAWDNWRHTADPLLVNQSNELMHRLFKDSREIRRDYLQGIGGNSYGTLVRKLLNPNPQSRLLIVGAGDLAISLLPFFSAFYTAIWNRHAVDLQNDVRTFAPDESCAAFNWATQLIITTPPEPANEARWARMANAAAIHPPVVHLGRRRANQGIWSDYKHLLDLDDIFDLRHSQSSLRSLNILRARQACAKKAQSYVDDHVPMNARVVRSA